jgi:hypothetical protein
MSNNCSNLVLTALEELQAADADQVAEHAGVSPTTAHKWLRTFLASGTARLIRTRYGREHYEIVPVAQRPTGTAPGITAQEVLDHRPHPIAAAPHLLVCTCGETFSAIEAQSTAGEQWAVHVANELSQRVRP